MNAIFHRAWERGHVFHGWLDTYHSFSFAEYYDREKMNFWALRVLNDDTIAWWGGFPTHPHSNMEIITIPLEWAVYHRDSMGNEGIIKAWEIQVMSAGTGILHSEFNASKTDPLHLLQIWVYPNIQNVIPRYDQYSFLSLSSWCFHQIVSPNNNDQGVWIHQEAWFHLGEFQIQTNTSYTLKNPNNGVYVLVIFGEVEIGGKEYALTSFEALGIVGEKEIELSFQKPSRVLLIEVPML